METTMTKTKFLDLHVGTGTEGVWVWNMDDRYKSLAEYDLLLSGNIDAPYYMPAGSMMSAKGSDRTIHYAKLMYRGWY